MVCDEHIQRGREAYAKLAVVEVIFRAHDQFAIDNLVDIPVFGQGLQFRFGPDPFWRLNSGAHGVKCTLAFGGCRAEYGAV